MAKAETLSKAQRLHKLCHLLYRHPYGLTASELARLCGVSSRTIQRDLQDLEEMHVPIWDDEGNPPRYGIIEGYYLPPIHLDLDDALALYLAGRLLARYADTFNPHIAQALAKLAGILPEPMANHIHATIRMLSQRQADETFERVLQVLTLAWATGRKARIWYQAAQSENIHEYLFCPYFIEPSAAGSSTYAIGYSSYFEDVHTFKVERIRDARLTTERYEIPENFDGPAVLSSAWGIMYGPEVEEVILRFRPAATRRVKETFWHPTQRIEDTEDGGCILHLQIAHPKEMLYWIRGWGAQVEVLAPSWLRQQLKAEARELNKVYEER